MVRFSWRAGQFRDSGDAGASPYSAQEDFMAAVASIFRTDRGLIHMVPSPTLGPAADRESLASWFRSFRLVAGFRILAAQSGRSTQTTLETQSLLAGAVQAR